MPFAATWMDLEIVILSEISQTEKDNYHMIWLTCRIWKIDTNEFKHKREIYPESYETNLWLPKEKGPERGIDEMFGINRYTLLSVK